MKSWSKYFLFGGLILIIGPSFGFTLRGAGSMNQSDSAATGLALLAISLVFYLVANRQEAKRAQAYEQSQVQSSTQTPEQ